MAENAPMCMGHIAIPGKKKETPDVSGQFKKSEAPSEGGTLGISNNTNNEAGVFVNAYSPVLGRVRKPMTQVPSVSKTRDKILSLKKMTPSD